MGDHVRVVEVEVYVESTDRRVFTCAYQWPGWARSGKTEDQALDTLVKYAPRYAPVAKAAGLEFAIDATTPPRVLDRVQGNATTAFGAPAQVMPADLEKTSEADAARLMALLAGCWTILDRVAAAAPESLRKGPRGGGRDRSKILEHVVGAEVEYGRMLGLKLPGPDLSSDGELAAHRAALLQGLRLADTTFVDRGKGWPMRYATRRLAWHVMDHAWEMEDRSER